MSSKRKPEKVLAPNKKRVKFDDGSASTVRGLEAFTDDVDDEDDLEFAKKKRNRIKEGYTESDEEELNSDDENDKGKEKDDDDMFGGDFDEDKKPKNKGKISYVSKEKIDQQGVEQDGEDVEEGVIMEPFNMNQELEEGGFDSEFNYIRTKDEHAIHDNWLQGLTGNEIRKAKSAHERQEARALAIEAEEENLSENALWCLTLGYLQPRETIAAGIKRLSGRKKVPAWKKNKRKAANEEKEDADMESPEAEAAKKRDMEKLISLSDKLTELGRYDVMEQTYESIVRVLRAADVLHPLPQSSSSKTSDKSFWEYKWGESSEELFGPFISEQMAEWQKKGFFEGDAWVRQVTSSTPLDASKGFIPVSDANFG
ncbi:hypothetical protein HDU76_000723 [Blyttiomyces sp. JEL0837]|nr:hypothetical protein HDU76_000723 [Blyttiomyces sp. JEL0837]